MLWVQDSGKTSWVSSHGPCAHPERGTFIQAAWCVLSLFTVLSVTVSGYSMQAINDFLIRHTYTHTLLSSKELNAAPNQRPQNQPQNHGKKLDTVQAIKKNHTE